MRAAVESNLMLRDALVEISVIAARPDLPRQIINPPGRSANPRPYSRAIAVGDYIFVAGLVSRIQRPASWLMGM